MPSFDKYDLYIRAVQSPESDATFLNDIYKKIRKKTPSLLREDFCGTFSLCCEWVKLDKKKKAFGVDKDQSALQYGKNKILSKLKDHQRSRVKLYKKDVLDSKLPQADILAALNFSYYCFKQREVLLSYFKNVYKRLKKDGIFVTDSVGGPSCQEPNEEFTDYGDFIYFWDQDSYDFITQEANFYIHFQKKGQKKVEKVFRYDWRLWTLREVRDLMEEVGFKKTHVYWEKPDEKGDGSGEFVPMENAEEALDSWVAYIVGEK